MTSVKRIGHALALTVFTLAAVFGCGGDRGGEAVGEARLAATLPPSFVDEVIANGLLSPTAMTFAPDGRLFVCQQGGQVRVIKNGALALIARRASSCGGRARSGMMTMQPSPTGKSRAWR